MHHHLNLVFNQGKGQRVRVAHIQWGYFDAKCAGERRQAPFLQSQQAGSGEQVAPCHAQTVQCQGLHDVCTDEPSCPRDKD